MFTQLYRGLSERRGSSLYNSEERPFGGTSRRPRFSSKETDSSVPTSTKTEKMPTVSQQLRVTLSNLSLPSARRIGRSNSLNPRSSSSSSKLQRRPSRIGALLFGTSWRERSSSKSPKASENEPKGNSTNFALTSYEDDDAKQNPRVRSFRDQSSRFGRDSSFRQSKDESPVVNENKRRSKELSRKGSKLRVIFSSKSERPQFVIMTDEMIRLETIIQQDKGKHRLVQELLTVRGDHAVKVRFCSAVDKFDACQDEAEREALAHTLVQTFLSYGCLFYIPSLSDARYNAIVHEHNYNQLLHAKREVLEDLSRNPDVMRMVDMVESMDDL